MVVRVPEMAIKIKNGRLKDFEPAKNLSRFADVNELKDLNFSTLSNTIEIKNNTIFIPKMNITTNALSLTLSGSHKFDNYIDYRHLILN